MRVYSCALYQLASSLGTGSAIHSAGSVTDQGFASKGQSRQPSEDQAAQTADAMKIAHDLQSATKSNFQSDNSINSNNEKGNPENRKQINHDLSNGVGEPAGRPSGPVFKGEYFFHSRSYFQFYVGC